MDLELGLGLSAGVGPHLYLAAAIAAVTAAVAALAKRLGWPAPVLLVLAGLGLSLLPGLPRVEIAPDLVLLVFLPPIIYTAAFGSSWRAFRANLPPIILLAFGCVLATAAAVAAVGHWWIGLAWPTAFLLGAIVSPPDVIAPLAIVRRLGVPGRIADVLEGEGLVNDATALVLFNFALAAATTGAFDITQAGLVFAADVVGEIGFGCVVGWTMLRLRGLAGEPRIEITLSLLTPYLAFWLPHELGGSGVLATVVVGLYVGAQGVMDIPSSTRLQAVFFWDFVTYLLTGAIFLATGLQARIVLDGLGDLSIGRLMLEGLAVSLAVIVVRFLWVFPTAHLTRLLIRRIRERQPAPPWRSLLVVAFVGVRGVVSLAAALSIPLEIGQGRPFPDRAVVLFLTFSVILLTLVVQGPTLSAVVRSLGLLRAGQRERRRRQDEEASAELEAARAALARLDQVAAAEHLPAPVVDALRVRHQHRIHHLEHRDDGDGEGARTAAQVEAGELALLKLERAHVTGLAGRASISDEVRRRIERDLDLREEALRRNLRGVSNDED